MRPDDALSHEFRGLVTCRTLYDQETAAPRHQPLIMSASGQPASG